MRIAIDGAGRLVIPKSIRDHAGLRPGTEVEIEFRDGRIEIEATSATMGLVEDERGAIVSTDRDIPPLTAADVREVLERVRR